MAATPRYKELADALRREVLDGVYIESGFPTESALCQRFNVSRFTVREALRALTADGLITRKRGSGTVIQPATARGGALHQPLSNVAEIMQYARNTRTTFELVGDAPLPRGIAQHLDLLAVGRWTMFKGLRTAPGSSEPIAATDAYVHESLRDYAMQIAPNEDTIFNRCPLSQEGAGQPSAAHVRARIMSCHQALLPMAMQSGVAAISTPDPSQVEASTRRRVQRS